MKIHENYQVHDGVYESSLIADRIKIAASNRRMTVKETMERCGMFGSKVQSFYKSYPKVDTLTKIANSLNVSLDYLAGRTDVMEIATEKQDDSTEQPKVIVEKIPVFENSNVSEIEYEMLSKFRELGFSEKLEIMNLINAKANK